MESLPATPSVKSVLMCLMLYSCSKLESDVSQLALQGPGTRSVRDGGEGRGQEGGGGGASTGQCPLLASSVCGPQMV